MKKIWILILATTMIAALLAACSGNNNGGNIPGGGTEGNGDGSSTNNSADYPTLRLFLGNDITPDKDMVAEAVSVIAREKIGANIEFVMYGPGEYREKIPLLLASNEKMDIGFDAGFMGYLSRARADAYYDLTELLQSDNKALYDTINPLLWQGVTVDGKVYGVPTNKEAAEQWALYAETSFLEEVNIDPASITSLEDAEVILKALEDYPDRPGFMITPKTAHAALYHNKEYTYVSANKLISVSLSDSEQLVNYFETERYKDFVYLMRDWFNKGYIAPDVATLTDLNRYNDADGNQITGLQMVSYTPFNENSWIEWHGAVVTPMPVTPIVITNNSTSGSINAVYRKSENPELAVKFLELWNTDPEVKNLITYGIEGRHYELVDGKVQLHPDYRNMYYGDNWRTGNTFISYLLESDPDDKHERFEQFNAAAIQAPTLGFQPDETPINDKIAATTAVISEYAPLLGVGAVDPDEYLPRFLNALRSAGSDDVLQEYQSQYDAWK